LRDIPFIMLTSSGREIDSAACEGVTAYLITGATIEDAMALAEQIIDDAAKRGAIGRRVAAFTPLARPLAVCDDRGQPVHDGLVER
jgi:hypothetical protein